MNCGSTDNGGRPVLDPGWTTYSKRVLYSVYDVTPVAARSNAMGVMLGKRMV
jgi:alpha-L-rhamnosidase